MMNKGDFFRHSKKIILECREEREYTPGTQLFMIDNNKYSY